MVVTGSASAADMPVKYAPPVKVCAADWFRGGYIGVNGGGVNWTANRTDQDQVLVDAAAGRVNETGCMVWNELATPDVAAAVEFYRELLGWEAEVDATGYATVRTSSGVNGGIRPLQDGEAVAVNLDIEPVEKPESVRWVDPTHPAE